MVGAVWYLKQFETKLKHFVKICVELIMIMGSVDVVIVVRGIL